MFEMKQQHQKEMQIAALKEEHKIKAAQSALRKKLKKDFEK